MHKFIVTRYLPRVGLIALVGSMALSGCGGGGENTTSTTTSSSITGSIVDGPMARATVSLYAISVDALSGDIAVSTTPVGTGTTDDQGRIQGLTMPAASGAPYLMKIEAVSGDTVDLNTCTLPDDTSISNCAAPVVGRLRTVITADTINADNPVYATPLTTMVSDLAINYANADAALTLDGFVNTYLPKANRDIASSFGMGMGSGIDILATPPIIDANTDTAEEQQATAQYRAAVAATVALLEQMSGQAADNDVNTLLVDLMSDLSDGEIDGSVNGVPVENYTTEELKILSQDPSNLIVPGTSYTVSQVAQMLVDEQASTGSSTDTASTNLASTMVDPIPVETNPDIDSDGVVNSEDAFPENSAEQSDQDGDGIGDNADPDDDNDGVLDVDDAFPLDSTQWTTATPTTGDADADGVTDASDNCSAVFNPNQTDTDGNSVGDACDSDDDGDGTADASDAFPLDNTEDTDTDNDGIGNNTDTDDDNDGIADTVETGQGTDPLLADTDGDGWNDNVDEAPTDDTVWYNRAPVARDDAATTAEDTSVTITLSANDTDADGTLATFNIPSNTSNGVALTDNGDGSVDFTPPGNWSGTDSFTYTVTDNNGKVSGAATVSITVNPVNDAPVGVNDTANTNEDTPVTIGNVLSNDTDVEGDRLSVSTADTTSANGGTVVNHGDGTFTYTPAVNWNGTDTFSYTVSDGSATDSASVTITIAAVNDAPAGVDDTASTNEDTPVTTGNVLSNDTDVEGDSLSVSAADTTSANGGTVVNHGDGTFTYTPAANWNGTDTFGYTVSDGSATDSATVTITVVAANDAPVAANDNASTNEDTLVTTGNVLSNDTDLDGDTLSVSIVDATSVNGGTVINNGNGTFNYTPAANWNGTDTFTYTVSDGSLNDVGTVTVTVAAVNDAPVAVDDSVSTNEDTMVTTGNVLSNDTDAEGDTLSVSSVDATSANGGTVSDNGDGTFDYTPAANWNGSDTFGYNVSDGASNDVGTVTITVSAVNDAPTAATASITTAANTTSTGVTPDVSDVDLANEGDSFTFAIASQPANGTATIVGNQLRYTPNTDYTGTDSFTFTATDSGGQSVTGTASVEVITGSGAVWGSFNWGSGVWQ